MIGLAQMTPDAYAFPTTADEFGGMTKRELIAAMAMQGFCAAEWTENTLSNGIAEMAVSHADALLAELSKV